MKLVADLTPEDKTEFIRLIRKGLGRGEAAHRIGSTGVQFSKLLSSRSKHFDLDFAVLYEKARESKVARQRRQARFY